MKKCFLMMIGGLLVSSAGFTQTSKLCDSVMEYIELNNHKADRCVLGAAEHVLSKPPVNDDDMKVFATVILAWMSKTSDYTFILNDKIGNLYLNYEKGILMIPFLACQAKAALIKGKGFEPESLRLFAAYLQNSSNKIKLTAPMKQFLQDCNDNKLEVYFAAE